MKTMNGSSVRRRRALVRAGRLSLLGSLWLVPALPLAAEGPPETAAGLEYVIGPGDVLQLFVWKEPELTKDVTVRLDGRITVSLLGDVQAAGRTPQKLSDEIRQRLGRFLEAPQVALAVGQANSSRFYVIGQVLKPGEFPLTGRTSLVQGLALAGGFKEFAKTDSIVIIREKEGSQVFLSANYKRLEAGRDISQNITLRPGDTIVVP